MMPGGPKGRLCYVVSPIDGKSDYGYTGEMQDRYIKLLFLRARYYNPASGQFITRDPWSGDSNRPQTFNEWGYGFGNPIKFIDPSGQCGAEGEGSREALDVCYNEVRYLENKYGIEIYWPAREGFNKIADFCIDWCACNIWGGGKSRFEGWEIRALHGLENALAIYDRNSSSGKTRAFIQGTVFVRAEKTFNSNTQRIYGEFFSKTSWGDSPDKMSEFSGQPVILTTDYEVQEDNGAIKSNRNPFEWEFIHEMAHRLNQYMDEDVYLTDNSKENPSWETRFVNQFWMETDNHKRNGNTFQSEHISNPGESSTLYGNGVNNPVTAFGCTKWESVLAHTNCLSYGAAGTEDLAESITAYLWDRYDRAFGLMPRSEMTGKGFPVSEDRKYFIEELFENIR
jgi:RHS repeat-associated protein